MHADDQNSRQANLDAYLTLVQRNKGRLDYEDCLLMGISLANLSYT